ncbi:dual serine/threonine and tyrosine protein kinase-like [Stylophora pistillata]|uniref:dual serine/threonine and tyrosine protein kinase-like n=1 Tax=Stylophora pistillata TaxID=50429 RepID=UPI000C04B167|nr:dual serine/threonine and tyrosine protein kinase-like [Stylophora pistillata]
MASGKTKTIDEINDLLSMFQALTALGISCEGLTTLEQMKSRVKVELNQSSNVPNWAAGQACSVLSEAREEDTRKKTALLQFFSQAETCFGHLDDIMLNLVSMNMGDVNERMRSHRERMKQREYFLLVAGETGAGKSSLVNLILGEELLPYSILSTTSTICEMRYGKERRVVIHFKDKDPETGSPTKIFTLAEPPEGATEQNYLQQISPYVHLKSDREKGSIYKKVELHWPHQLLKNGIVIIDSPGVGESDIMDEIVTEYLPRAFAFIYVLNSANAGGVQKDRLEKLVTKVVGKQKEGQEEFPPKCALFVCNKWDQVPKGEINEVKSHVVKKLKKCWPGLDPESQIVYMSTMMANTAQRHGIITEDFSSLMNGVKAMVSRTIEARLEINWRWLDDLLSRITYHTTAYVKNASRDHVKSEALMALILLRLMLIKQQQNEVMEDLRSHLKDRIDKAVQKLSDYLRSDGVKSCFTSWTLDEVPKAETSWEVTKNSITKVLERRLQNIIENWEEDNHVFANTRESLLEHFQKKYNFISGELRNLQSAVTSDEVMLESDAPDEESFFSLGEKVAIGVTSPLWVPLGLVAFVIGAPVVGVMVIKSKLENKSKIKKYEKDKCTFMAGASADYLDEVIKESILKSFVKHQLNAAKLCLKQIEARIPELIQADIVACKQLKDETRSKKDIIALYKPILDEAVEIRGRLAVFGLREVRAVDVSSKELDWKEDDLLGSGAFASVYRGKMNTENGEERTVALKVCHEWLHPGNASLILNEIDFLKKLQHPYIVTFYGMSLLDIKGKLKVIMVMEHCKGNLKNHIFRNINLAPANSKNVATIREGCRWVRDISAALAFIHQHGVVHRDLKLENILLSETNSAKITDVGVSKGADDITGTIAGTPLYMAPEVFHSQLYDNKADIYSLGILMWEIWYRRQVFCEVEVRPPTIDAFFAWVDKGNRPQHLEGCSKPPGGWQYMMKSCWETDPNKRPTAEWCNKEANNLCKMSVKEL